MHVTLVHVKVKPDRLDDFVEATRLNHEASIQEPGNLRFDVLRHADDPQRFVLYEAYASAEDASAHKKTAHYLRWRETVAEWMAAPREGVSYSGLFPDIGGEG
jgi:autoinducer 2-degrading protein